MFRSIVEKHRLQPPTLVFTKAGNPAAEGVIEAINNLPDPGWPGVHARVFQNDDEIRATFANGHEPARSIALWDGHSGGYFTFAVSGRTSGPEMPSWAQGAQWGTHVNAKVMTEERPRSHCAEVLRAHFGKRFHTQLEVEQQYPWGALKKKEKLPNRPRLNGEIVKILDNLRNGPDMAEEVFEAVRGRLPEGEKISWIRVPDRPAEYNRAMMERCLGAMSSFEAATSAVLAEHPQIGDQLMLGVELDPEHPELRGCYLTPRADGKPLMRWSVRRPDMHVCGKTLVASENDEMPGGFTDCFHVDRSYGVNRDTWREAFEWLCSRGPLLFLVSHDWSRPYITSMRWMAAQMSQMGFPAYCLTTDALEAISLETNGVFATIDDVRIKVGTIWRQFPVFETRGLLADLVVASNAGLVRMVPEFAHFGSKSWFALFHEHLNLFRGHLTHDEIETLQMLIPRSCLVVPNRFSVIHLGGKAIHSYDELVHLDQAGRNELVLKVTGANRLAARSHGVLMGHAQQEGNWRQWLGVRAAANEPFITQERFQTSLEHIAVWNTVSRSAEPFACRILLRPWQVGERLVTTHTACTPHDTTKVHGMLDMAVQPIIFV